MQGTCMNFSVVFKIVLSMLKKYVPSNIKNICIKQKKMIAGLSDKHLSEMLWIEPDFFFMCLSWMIFEKLNRRNKKRRESSIFLSKTLYLY